MIRKAKLIPRVSGEDILGRHLFGNLPRQCGGDTSLNVDRRELVEFGLRLFGQFLAFACQIGIFGIRL